MIPTYYSLLLIAFSVLCTVNAQFENARFNESLDCKCGKKDGFSFRIVGGREAKPHAHPWMAALYSKLYKQVFCGGALINDRYVVTAGHCVRWSRYGIAVIMGLHDKTAVENDKKEGVAYEVEKIIFHPEFTSVSFYDIEDIALIKLDRPVEFTKTIRPVCLPKNPDDDYSDKEATVIGWGKVNFKRGETSRYLKETNLRVLSHEECKKNSVIGSKVLNSMLCAYRDETDACQGDSGGPLTYETDSKISELIGVVSWGIDCAKPDVPGIYTRVTTKLDWIAETTKDAAYCRN